ncbi:MAG: glycosyltransferase family 2 protein, partial [Candidatus Woesearchaeota archaeon]
MKFSVVVPVYNEEGNIFKLDSEIRSVMNKLGSYEIIYVNDGSTDNSLRDLKKLKKAVVIDLNRNYGQSIALDAGFKMAAGEIVISMDGDLQNDPADIPKMVKMLVSEDLDVVAGWRKKRKDSIGINILTRMSRFIRGVLIKDGVHDTGCTLRVYRSEAVKSLDLWGEMHRYILALLRWKGFKIGEIVVNHRARIHGKTKYGYDKAMKGFIDLIYIWFISKYSSRPLHLFGKMGIVSVIIGVICELKMAYEKIFQGVDLSNNGWFIVGFFFIGLGIMLFTTGILMDLLIRVH